MKKRQHFVPKFYLREFARKKKSGEFIIRAYNKAMLKQLEPNISKVAVERYFYDANDPPIIENFLSLLESDFAKVIKKIINERSLDNLNDKDYTILCNLIVNFNERTKSAEIRNRQIAKLLHEKKEEKGEGSLLKDLSEEEMERWFKKKGKIGLLVGMLAIYSDEYEENKVFLDNVKKMLNLHWMLGFNNTEHELYTSDHPVVIINPDKNEVPIAGFGSYAYSSRGVEIYLPLSPYLCLIICDPIHSTYKGYTKNRVMLHIEEVKWLNSLTINNAFMFVFSKGMDFQFVKKKLLERPELKNPYRKRVHKNKKLMRK